MVLSRAQKILGNIAAVLGIAEGLSWVCMSLIAIVLHFWKPELEIGSSYGEYVGSLLYHKFILDDVVLQGSFIINGTAFNVFMWIYFIHGVLWCAISLDQLTAVCSNKRRQVVVMRIWGGLTLFISVIDLMFTMLLAMDYTSCGGTGSSAIDYTSCGGASDYTSQRDDSSDVISEPQCFCYLTEGVVMTMAAKGYTLWILNIVLSIILITVLRREPMIADDSTSSVYSTIPRARLAKPLGSYSGTR